jgi:hypothetical protein
METLNQKRGPCIGELQIVFAPVLEAQVT